MSATDKRPDHFFGLDPAERNAMLEWASDALYQDGLVDEPVETMLVHPDENDGEAMFIVADGHWAGFGYTPAQAAGM